VIHRDIKLDNILINKVEEGEFKIKISDFGLATFKPKEGQKLYDKSGTPCYMAPELLRGVGYTEKADIFSLGSVFFNLLTGHYMFNGANVKEVLKKNEDCDLSKISIYLQQVSPQCRQLLMDMVSVDPNKRPSAHEAILHPWFQHDINLIQDLLDNNRSL
jgi:serine/threonine protein kinase